jgi:hypothetical protein
MFFFFVYVFFFFCIMVSFVLPRRGELARTINYWTLSSSYGVVILLPYPKPLKVSDRQAVFTAGRHSVSWIPQGEDKRGNGRGLTW